MANELEFTRDNFDKIIKLNAEMNATMQNIINGCVHPEVAYRAVMVDLAPIRKAVKKNSDLYGNGQ